MKLNKKVQGLFVAGLISATAITGAIMQTQPEIQSSATAQVTQVQQTGTTNTGLNLRKSSSIKGAKITVMPKGAKVTILNKESNGWYKVQYNGTTGYASGSYITLGSQTTTPNTNTNTTGTGTTTANLHLRSGNSTSKKSLKVIPKGAKVTILNKESNGWYKVQYNGTTGYASGAYIKVNSQTTTPTPTPTPEVKPQENAIGTGKTTANLHLREGNSTSKKSLKVIPKGAKVEILNKESNGWYKVRYNGTVGYSSGAYIVLDSQTPTPQPTPEVKPEVKPEVTPQPTPEVKPEVKPEVTPEPVQPEPTPEVKPQEPTPQPTPEVKPEVKPMSFNELATKLEGMGFNSEGNFRETDGGYSGIVKATNSEVMIALQRNTPNFSNAIKSIFNSLLPTQGSKLWSIVTNPCSNQTLQMDGRTVLIEVFPQGVFLTITE